MRRKIIPAIAAMFLAAACTRPAPQGPPVVVEASQVDPLLYWASDLDGRRIAIDGYLSLDNGPKGEAIAIGQTLTTQPAGHGEALIRVEAPQGRKPGQLDLPVLSREETLPGVPAAGEVLTIDMAHATYQDAEGKPHPLSQRVRVIGRLDYDRVTNVGLMSEPDGRSPTGRRLRPRLADVTLDRPPAR